MTKKAIQITLLVMLEDLPDTERGKAMEEFGIEQDDLPRVSELDPREIAHIISEHLRRGDQQEIWAGTGIFARISDATLISVDHPTPAPGSAQTEE